MNSRSKKIGLTQDDLIKKINECDSDIKELKAESKNLYDIWKRKANEIGEISVIGGNIVKLLELRDKNIDKKLKLISQLSDIIDKQSVNIKNNSEDEEDTSKIKIPDDIKNQLNDIFVQKKAK